MSGIVGEVERRGGIISSQPFAMLKLSATQSISSGSMTKVAFDEMYGRSHSKLSSNGWVVPESGYYKVDLQIAAFTASNNIQDVYPHVKLDSTTMNGGYMTQVPATRHTSALVTGLFHALRTQIIYGYGQLSGTSPNFYHDSGTSFGRNTTTMIITFLGK